MWPMLYACKGTLTRMDNEHILKDDLCEQRLFSNWPTCRAYIWSWRPCGSGAGNSGKVSLLCDWMCGSEAYPVSWKKCHTPNTPCRFPPSLSPSHSLSSLELDLQTVWGQLVDPRPPASVWLCGVGHRWQLLPWQPYGAVAIEPRPLLPNLPGSVWILPGVEFKTAGSMQSLLWKIYNGQYSNT